jgi:DNA invertase Pin-like site-specific DNA recombinase
MPVKPRVAIYARVSTTDQTLDSQLRDLREYCERRGWEAVEFVDHGVSGAKDSRPGWNACWDAVQKRQVDVLVVHALDRLGRSLTHLVRIITYLTEHDLSLVSYRENIDLSTSAGRMLAGIFATMAEYERSIISERTKAGMRAAKARGKQIGNLRRYFDERMATALRAQGWGQIRIAKKLGVGVGTVNAWIRSREELYPGIQSVEQAAFVERRRSNSA